MGWVTLQQLADECGVSGVVHGYALTYWRYTAQLCPPGRDWIRSRTGWSFDSPLDRYRICANQARKFKAYVEGL